MKRGELWWAQLPAPTGSGPGYRRPVLVIQANAFTASRIATVVVAAVTSNLALSEAPGNVRVSRSESGLPVASVVNVSRLVTLDKRMLVGKTGRLTGATMDQVDAGLRLVLSLR